MKTITFFSEKGGVGKSSFSIMYASWLKHQHGLSVALADFNHRIAKYRSAEVRNRNKFIEKNPDAGAQPFDENNTWPIYEAYLKEIDEIKDEGIQIPYAEWFKRAIKRENLDRYDVVLCDFPGSLDDGSYAQLLSQGLIRLTVIPTEKDEMTLASTLKLHNILKKHDKNHCCFINKAQLGLKNFRNSYLTLGKRLTASGVPMLPDIVTYSERMTTIDKVDIIRSTFGFPDFSRKEYENISDLGLENLFIDVTRELAKTDDLPGTPAADLGFVEQMQKKKDGRYFKGSSFPEYEI